MRARVRICARVYTCACLRVYMRAMRVYMRAMRVCMCLRIVAALARKLCSDITGVFTNVCVAAASPEFEFHFDPVVYVFNWYQVG